MIAKGNLHNSGARLARYMLRATDGERVELYDLRGFADPDLVQALRSVDATAKAGTRCDKPFFHVQVRNHDDDRPLSRAEWMQVADRIEAANGLSGQPRAIVFHLTATGKEHMHIAFSRIDGARMKAG